MEHTMETEDLELVQKLKKSISKFTQALCCQADIAYPPIIVKEKNKRYGELLYGVYAKNGNSELRSITQYMQHTVNISDREIGKILFCISLIEIKHLEVLEQLINLLGENSLICNCNKKWINVEEFGYGYRGEVDDNSEICTKLRMNMLSEKGAIYEYKTILKEINDEYIKKVIEKIIADEMMHLEILNSILKDYSNEM